MVSVKDKVSMKTAAAVQLRRTAADVVEKTAAIHGDLGLAGLAARACHRLAAPIVKWGGITFFERRLDAPQFTRAPSAPGMCARQFSPSDIDALRAGGDPTQSAAALAARFRRGDRAFGAEDENGRICHVRWVSTTRVHIPEIDRDIVLRPHEAYFYNGYTRPDVRRCGVDGLVRHFIFNTLRAEGFVAVCSYVRHDNRVVLHAASRWQRPVGTVRYVTPLRCRPIVRGASAEGLPALVAPDAIVSASTDRVNAWQAWFRSWIDRPLATRSTGYAALDDADFQSAAAFIQASLDVSESDAVLDVGCDSAMITRHIAPRVRRLLGIDFIHDMLRDTSRLPLTVAGGDSPWFVTADACRLPIRSGAFSKVYSSAMLHTLPTRAHGLQAIDELIRVTAAGGVVMLSSVPDTAKRLASRLDVWKRAQAADKLTLPIRWLIPGRIKTFARRVLRRPATGLPEFLDYDLKEIARSFEARGFQREIRDFPSDYWSTEFRTSRSNLLIHVPRARRLDAGH
jgi:ubiquinone/menaquinone biosynthesis C-methylase UbiE